MPGGRPTAKRGAEEEVKAKLCKEEISEARGGAQGRRRWLQATAQRPQAPPRQPPSQPRARALQWTVEWRRLGGEDRDMPHPTPTQGVWLRKEREERPKDRQ